MTHYIGNKKVLALLVINLLIGTYLLNYCSKIITCSILFIFLILSVHAIYALFGKPYALISLLMNILISYSGLWYGHWMQGNMKQNLVCGSFTSLVISVYLSIKVLHHLSKTYSFGIRHLISLILVSIVDSFLMSGFLLSKLSLHRVVSIFLKEVACRCSYALGIYILLFCFYFIIQKEYKKFISLIVKKNQL